MDPDRDGLAGAYLNASNFLDMRSRLPDVLILLTVIVLGTWWWSATRRAEPSAVLTIESPKPVPQMAGLPYPATPYELTSLEGGKVAFDGQGPLLILMATPNCDGCDRRAPLNAEAVHAARELGVPVHFLMWGSGPRADEKFAEWKVEADARLFTGNEIIQAYRGSEATCWAVVNEGQVVWQGADDLEGLKTALTGVAARAAEAP